MHFENFLSFLIYFISLQLYRIQLLTMLAFHSRLAKFQKTPQSALTSQYVAYVALARHVLAFSVPGSWAPCKRLRGKGLILEISRSYVACLENERGEGPPLLQSPPEPLSCPSPQGLAVSPVSRDGSGMDALRGRSPALAFPEGHSICSGEKHFHISSVYLFRI